MSNEFVERDQQESDRAESVKIDILVQDMRELKSLVVEIQKELRTAREELRNVEKLRPLRSGK